MKHFLSLLSVLIPMFGIGQVQIGGTANIQGSVGIPLTAPPPSTNGVPGNAVWSRNQIGSYRVLPACIATDHLDNIIAGGTYADAAGFTTDLGGGPLPYAPGFTGFLVKYSHDNVFQWNKSFTGGFQGVAADSANNILVTGNFTGIIDFGGGITLTSTLTPLLTYSADIFVAKYNSAGTVSWAKRYGGNNADGGTSIAVDASDNVVFASQFSSPSVDFGTGAIATVGDFDIALVKLSGVTGATTWARGMGSTAYDIPNAVAVDASGNAFFTGKAGGSINLGGGAVGTGGIVIGKYGAAAGAFSWGKALPGVAGYGIAADQISGNVFVSGQSNRIFLVSYDNSGSQLWAKGIGGSADIGRSVCVDSAGVIAFTGNVSGTPDFSGTGQVLIGGSFFVASYTTAGVYRWAKRPA